MRKIKLILEYDGTAYHGWQRQKKGLTIQQIVEGALRKMIREKIPVVAASRTDSGVHALGQVLHFSTKSSVSLRAFREGLNPLLPPDIVVREAQEVSLQFHARRDAKRKHYRYRIWNAPFRSPLLRNFSWHVRGPLDVERMNQASSWVVGEKDFSSFRSAGCASRQGRRRVYLAKWNRFEQEITFDIEANAFLRHMVRSLVGSIVQVGLGRWSVDRFQRALEACDRSQAAVTAPPQGLCLISVRYTVVDQSKCPLMDQ
ncbi:MAG: tRNA pseudouridine(38-40) synthase TruA [Deltaproteobacteria bacterium]|nr:tRNA pseudouridine(38-40) synthase TruA [Deltaproteobacteria bacterium]